MPLVKVEIIKGKSDKYKCGIMDGIHKALVDVFKIPNGDRIQRLYELDCENFEFSQDKTDNITIIEISIFEGRGEEAKERLYKEIVRNINKNSGIDGNDIIIILNEPPMCNWGIKGGISGSKYKFNFELNIE